MLRVLLNLIYDVVIGDPADEAQLRPHYIDYSNGKSHATHRFFIRTHTTQDEEFKKFFNWMQIPVEKDSPWTVFTLPDNTVSYDLWKFKLRKKAWSEEVFIVYVELPHELTPKEMKDFIKRFGGSKFFSLEKGSLVKEDCNCLLEVVGEENENEKKQVTPQERYVSKCPKGRKTQRANPKRYCYDLRASKQFEYVNY